MVAWEKVVTQPLGLTGYALTVLFWILRLEAKGKGHVLISRLCLIAAFVVLFGGFGLAYLQTTRSASASSNSQTNSFQQTTTGAGSPAVQGVQGDVHVTVDQSQGQAQGASPAVKGPKQKPK
jgi:hypothetical protein